MRILLDNSIISFSEFAEPAVKHVRLGAQTVTVHGIRRKPPDSNLELQKHIDALFTVGRLIRERRIIGYTYSELLIENGRGRGKLPDFNALNNCNLERCPPALERSRFIQTSNLSEWFAKGGKEDRRRGTDLGPANQIRFMSTLVALADSNIQLLLQKASLFNFSDFEKESLRQLGWFQELCRSSQSSEHYPDVFHLWTAERNELDAFLTLDFKFADLINRVCNQNNKTRPIQIRTRVLLPLDLLGVLGVTADRVPIEADRFYHLHEVPD